MTHKVDLINMVAQPLMGALGVGYKPSGVEGQSTWKSRGKNSHRNADYKTPEEKEAAMNRALAMFPVRVRTRKSAEDGADGAPSDG